jgi:exonuclease III
MTTESQRCNCFIRNGGNAIPKQAGPAAKGSNPTTGLTLLWVRGNFNHWQGQSGVMIWIHKSISNKIDHYKFWNNRIIKTRLKTQRGHLTILGVYTPTEGRDELNEECYETLQKVLDKVNRNDYIMLIGA